MINQGSRHKVGLIIQGPVVSGGMTGKTYGEGRTYAPNSSFVKFDSSEYISQNLVNAEKFEFIVISTWNTQDLSSVEIPEKLASKTHVVLSEDPTPNAKFIRAPIDGIPFAHQLNKVRQFYSILQGLNQLKLLGCTHAVKIRTDQLLDLEALHEEMTDFAEHNLSGLLVPGLRRESPLIINDFFLGAALPVFEVISRLMCNPTIEFNENVHIDLFYKTIWANPLESVNIPFSRFFLDNGKNSISTGQYFQEFSSKLFHPAASKIYKTIQWRGEQILHIQEDLVFSDDINANHSVLMTGDLMLELNLPRALTRFIGHHSLTRFIWSYLFNVMFLQIRRIRQKISTFRDIHGLRLGRK